ncbi:MAG: DUF4149 domain-containing protein [Rhodobacteraceae bacterium]|nr:DUF4149 domain-containing protein [Paracoccaceae bacterium]
MDQIALLSTAILLGGMTFFSFGYAPVLFKLLSMEEVRPILRGTFPYYYAVVIGLSGLCTALALGAGILPAALLALICASTLYARQILMHQINSAADREDKSLFGKLHGASVGIQLMQLGLCAWALLLI